jgi:hypothetical protein
VVFLIFTANIITVDFVASGTLLIPAEIRLPGAKVMYVACTAHSTAVITANSSHIVLDRTVKHFTGNGGWVNAELSGYFFE